MDTRQFDNLILQALEHEKGGLKVYQTALKCAVNDDLREEWEKYLDETRSHVEALTAVCRSLEIDASTETPERKIVRHLGGALVEAMEMALKSGDAGGSRTRGMRVRRDCGDERPSQLGADRQVREEAQGRIREGG